MKTALEGLGKRLSDLEKHIVSSKQSQDTGQATDTDDKITTEEETASNPRNVSVAESNSPGDEFIPEINLN
jgi:hypothetical protein